MNLLNHLPVLPVLIPFISAILLLLPPLRGQLGRQRIAVIIAHLLSIGTTVWLLLTVQSDGIQVYALGNWQAPFGIAFIADLMAVMIVLLTGVLALAAHLYACAGDDVKGSFFHPIFMFQVMGINGAFLTGDAFNMFVFFEILLIASYALMIHGGGKQRTQANLHYVFLNLIGSTLFLFALGTLYGTLGTLNFVDMARAVSDVSPENLPLVKAGGLLLLAIFGLKAALLPLHFWLPRTYSAATPAVAALFAVMTKVGIYSIWRIHGVIFGVNAGELANMAQPWLWPLAFMTLALGCLGILASQGLRTLVANLIIVSVGTLLMAVAFNTEQTTAAALYYLIHSTLVGGALFLIAGVIVEMRGKAEDRFVTARKMANPAFIGICFFIAALAVIGMPPFSGFVGKALLLKSTVAEDHVAWFWSGLLIAGLISLVTLARAGTTLFWRDQGTPSPAEPVAIQKKAAIALLLLCFPLLVVFGGPITEMTEQAANQLYHGIQLPMGVNNEY
ncbi:monovalent cation/H+ antiporter subunit D [Corallincola platygyrae]|uniref:Monovalent cation/H+ antiporter subunit D n=1 Tax=Corallincola platygyrae TaxID=1193278 RepID=A0ABW4XL71_9GAMM